MKKYQLTKKEFNNKIVDILLMSILITITTFLASFGVYFILGVTAALIFSTIYGIYMGMLIYHIQNLEKVDCLFKRTL